MIVADPKPLAEVASSVARFRKVLVLGCGGCVTICRAGGEAEARDLADRLSRPEFFPLLPPEFAVGSIERQCERDLVKEFLKVPPGTDAVLSLACGVGVQILADLFEPLPVLPALTTTFLGGADEPGVWKEKCRGCGDCLLARTAGICPIALCAKSLLNGPCGGSQEGRCEIGNDVPCAWARIVDRLEKQGRLAEQDEILLARDWRKANGGGPRERRRTGIALAYGDKGREPPSG